ncbi:hypothetical protein GCM10009827_037790 [Dactylosporangium maewongense]|uniref:Uncharacterized protein n=1 Tax=Dactylosporangium maewongense TaxID=634393 RepID=A0ABP4L8Z1_9ACTN
MMKADSSPPSRNAGFVAGFGVYLALDVTSPLWLPGYPDWQKAPAAALVALAVGKIVQRIARRLKDR